MLLMEEQKAHWAGCKVVGNDLKNVQSLHEDCGDICVIAPR